MKCTHESSGIEMYDFAVPYIGTIRVCWDCRRELALRTIERPHGLLPIDCGRIGYGCKKCGGTFTSTDAMTCTCPERETECQEIGRLHREWWAWNQLVNTWHKPKPRVQVIEIDELRRIARSK